MTLLALIAVLAAAVFSMISIFRLDDISFTAKTENLSFQNYNMKLTEMIDKLNINAEVAIRENFTGCDQLPEPIDFSCEDFDASAKIRMPNFTAY